MPHPDDLALPPGARDEIPDSAPLLGTDALAAKHKAGMRAGIFCSACGQAMDEPGWEYVSFRTELREGQPVCLTGRAFICGRECCTEPRRQLDQSAAARRPWAAWTIFYVEPPDSLPEEVEQPLADSEAS